LWRSGASGRIFVDDNYLYDIVLDPDPSHRRYFEQLLREFLEDRDSPLGLDQEAVLLIFSQVETLYLERAQP